MQHTAYFSLSALTTHANEPQEWQDLRGYWTLTKFVATYYNLFIDDVNATIRVAIRPLVVEWEGDIKKKV